MKGYIYICLSHSGRYYVGSTVDVESRLKQHASGNNYSTKRLGSLKLVFSQEFPSITEARKVEARIKSWKRRDYIEKIISSGSIRDT